MRVNSVYGSDKLTESFELGRAESNLTQFKTNFL